MVRILEQVDFEISADTLATKAFPAQSVIAEVVETLFANAIVPVLGNHRGLLHLHTSAVRLPRGVVALLGPSRSGKATLAAAMAREGFPRVTEDVLELRAMDRGYPTTPRLRRSACSATALPNC